MAWNSFLKSHVHQRVWKSHFGAIDDTVPHGFEEDEVVVIDRVKNESLHGGLYNSTSAQIASSQHSKHTCAG